MSAIVAGSLTCNVMVSLDSVFKAICIRVDIDRASFDNEIVYDGKQNHEAREPHTHTHANILMHTQAAKQDR
jgi:hypothetical protein